MRQIKAFLSWAQKQGVLQIKLDGLEVTFDPLAQNDRSSTAGLESPLSLQPRTKEQILKEEEELLYASAG